MTKAGEKLGHYGFVVDYKANKIEIKLAIEKMYNVTVERINTMRVPGKLRPVILRLVLQPEVQVLIKSRCYFEKGETIDFYSNI